MVLPRYAALRCARTTTTGTEAWRRTQSGSLRSMARRRAVWPCPAMTMRSACWACAWETIVSATSRARRQASNLVEYGGVAQAAIEGHQQVQALRCLDMRGVHHRLL